MDYERTIMHSVDLLVETDEKIGDVWKTPSPYDCIRFAMTEVGEVVNDQINLQSAGYARNNFQRAPVVAKELADVGMMLLKYFLAVYKSPEKIKEVITEKTKELTDKNGKLILPETFVNFLKSFGIDPQVVSDISKIAILVSYSMMMMEAQGPGASVETIIVATLMLIVGHELFAEQTFSEYLDKKLGETIKKVTTREMKIV